MEQIIIKIICVLLLIIGIIVIWKKRNLSELIINDKFWIFVSWEFCLILYCFIGIKYPVELSLKLLLYIIAFWLSYLLGSVLAKIIRFKKKKAEEKKEEIDFKEKIDLKPFFIVSVIGTILYVAVIIWSNPGIKIGITRNIELNALNTMCLILSSVSLIVWLYELIYSLVNSKRITIYGIVSAVLFNIPGIVISGRDALMIFIISTLIAVIYSLLYLKKNNLITNKLKKGIKIVGLGALAVIILYLFLISSIRYGTTDGSVLKTFEEASKATFPKYLVSIYEHTGVLGKLILNIVFYYSSQFSKLFLVFKEYNGPYQYGSYQLHYVSRAVNLLVPGVVNSSMVSSKIGDICFEYGVPGLRVFWGTIIEYSIYDFGRIGSLIYALIMGFVVKKITNRCNSKKSILSIIALIMICVGMFTTVEISPLFDYFYIFPIAWIIIIFFFNKRFNRK